MTRYAGCTCHAQSLEPCRFCSATVDPDLRALSLAESRLRRLVDRLENVRGGIMDVERHPCGYEPSEPEDCCRGNCAMDEAFRLESEIQGALAVRAKIENEVRS